MFSISIFFLGKGRISSKGITKQGTLKVFVYSCMYLSRSRYLHGASRWLSSKESTCSAGGVGAAGSIPRSERSQKRA